MNPLHNQVSNTRFCFFTYLNPCCLLCNTNTEVNDYWLSHITSVRESLALRWWALNQTSPVNQNPAQDSLCTTDRIVWSKEALRIWLLSLENVMDVTPLLCALSNLRRHWPVWIFHTYTRRTQVYSHGDSKDISLTNKWPFVAGKE